MEPPLQIKLELPVMKLCIWQTNIFKLPFRKEGRAFVNELVRLFRAYAESSSMEIIPLKVAMTLPNLFTPEPRCTSKVKHNKCIERRFSCG